MGTTVIDFATLMLPADVWQMLADAFWNHVGARPASSVLQSWRVLRKFGRFVAEKGGLHGLADVNEEMLLRYIDWLNVQQTAAGVPWSKTTRNAAYGTLRGLLRWVERCRPGRLAPIDYPFNPFPWRNRDTRHRCKAAPQVLQALLKACERDIAQMRTQRQCADSERAAAGLDGTDPRSSLGALLAYIDRHFGGVLPPARILDNHRRVRDALMKFGGREPVERCLYPKVDSILPYYLAIVAHTAGNTKAIATLACDCLQALPLLEDRELLIWKKPRASSVQRRSFQTGHAFEPPTLVRELLKWTSRLRPHARDSERHHLFLIKGASDTRSLARTQMHHALRRFEARHGLTHIDPASIRGGVLTSIYRATGNLRQVKAIANHSNLSTTVGYVESPEVEAQNRMRIAALQRAFLGHLKRYAEDGDQELRTPERRVGCAAGKEMMPAATAVSMFGFGCRDPFSGTAPGTRAGELCHHFLGCFTCPNAVIGHDTQTLARLLQARNHLREGTAQLHPARWEAVYAVPLRILEEDILTRFGSQELAAADHLRATLPPLPPLR